MKYNTVSFPDEILRLVDHQIEKDPFYSSRAEYIRMAIKEKIEADEMMRHDM